MVRCTKCSAQAVTYIRYNGNSLCQEHFTEYVDKRIKKEIRAQLEIGSGKHIAVAISGGKDSSVTLVALAKILGDRRDVRLSAFTVDEGIATYRPATLKKVIQLTDRLGIEHHIVSFREEVGTTMDELAPISGDQSPCSFCGVFRRRIVIPERQRKEMEETASRLLTLRMQDGFSPCVLGFRIEGAFSRKLDLRCAANLLNMVGEVTVNEEEGWCSIDGVTLFDEGALVAKGNDQKAIREKVERVRRAVVKAEECVGCGVCVARCKEGALLLEQNKVHVIALKCIHCGGCMEPCPAVSFGDTTFDF